MSEKEDLQEDCHEEIVTTIVSWIEIASEQNDEELYWKAIHSALGAAFSLAAYKLGKSGEDYFKGLILHEVEESFEAVEDMVPGAGTKIH